MMTEKELRALADSIEESDGLAVIKPTGPIQIGIKKTSVVIAVIRAAASLRALAELPLKGEITVECKCGWRGFQSTLVYDKETDENHCPLCHAMFVAFPATALRT